MQSHNPFNKYGSSKEPWDIADILPYFLFRLEIIPKYMWMEFIPATYYATLVRKGIVEMKKSRFDK